MPVEVAGHRLRGRVTVGGRLGERSPDHAIEGDDRRGPREGGWLLVQRRLHHLHRLRPRKRGTTRQRLEEHDPRREDVGARVDRVAQDLLRRHVAWGPHDQAGSRQVALQREGAARLRREGPRQAEVQQLRAARRQEHVGGLHVTVDDALRVQGREGGEHLAPQAQGLGHRQRPALQPLRQGLAVEQLHGDEEPSRVLADLEYLAGMRVADAGGGAGFASEALAAFFVGIADGLQRHAAAEARVLGRVDDTHPSLAELVEDAIAADLLGQPGRAGRGSGGPGGGGREAAQETLEPSGASDARGGVLGGQVVVGIGWHGWDPTPTLPRPGRCRYTRTSKPHETPECTCDRGPGRVTRAYRGKSGFDTSSRSRLPTCRSTPSCNRCGCPACALIASGDRGCPEWRIT